jgi:hypothetical protein
MLGSHPRGALKHYSASKTTGRESIAMTIGDSHACPIARLTRRFRLEPG